MTHAHMRGRRPGAVGVATVPITAAASSSPGSSPRAHWIRGGRLDRGERRTWHSHLGGHTGGTHPAGYPVVSLITKPLSRKSTMVGCDCGPVRHVRAARTASSRVSSLEGVKSLLSRFVIARSWY